MLKITVSNRKGGTGKSLSAMGIACTYAERGSRVLLVDLDCQGSASSGYFGPTKAENLPAEATAAALFDPELSAGVTPDAVIHPSGVPGIDVIPANSALTPYNPPVNGDDTQPTNYLAQFLVDLGGRYDVCVVDTPPNLQLCTLSAMTASDHVIIPLACEDFASQGVPHVLRAVAGVRAAGNPGLEVLGILLNQHDARLAVHKAFERVLRGQFKELVFDTRIPLAAVLKEAIARRVPITAYRPRSAAAVAFRNLVAEIDARIGVVRGQD